MKRFYYDCSIMAAHMIKYYGMKLECIDEETGETYPFEHASNQACSYEMWGDIIEDSDKWRKIYVCEGSLPILDLQMGDTFRWTVYKGKPYEETHVKIVNDEGFPSYWNVKDYDEYDASIIQRQNIAFHYPKETIQPDKDAT